MIDFNNNAAVFGKKDIVITPKLEETYKGLAATVNHENIKHYMEKNDDYTLEVLRNKKSYEDAHFGTRLFEPGQFFRLSFTTEESLNTLIEQLLIARELRFGTNNRVAEFYKDNTDEEVTE